MTDEEFENTAFGADTQFKITGGGNVEPAPDEIYTVLSVDFLAALLNIKKIQKEYTGQ